MRMVMHRYLVLLFLLPLLGMGGDLPSLDESTILYLPEPGCEAENGNCFVPGTPSKYLVQASFDEDWMSLAHLAKKGLGTGDCVSFALLDEPRFRACCQCESAICCSEEAGHSVARPTCRRIFDLMSGREYDQGEVDGWNAGG